MKVTDKLKCSIGLCDWVYEDDYDSMQGHTIGKIYRCSRCKSRKWVTHDGRVYFR